MVANYVDLLASGHDGLAKESLGSFVPCAHVCACVTLISGHTGVVNQERCSPQLGLKPEHACPRAHVFHVLEDTHKCTARLLKNMHQFIV